MLHSTDAWGHEIIFILVQSKQNKLKCKFRSTLIFMWPSFLPNFTSRKEQGNGGEKIQIWAPFSKLAEEKASWNMDLLMKMSKMAQVLAYLAYDTRGLQR